MMFYDKTRVRIVMDELYSRTVDQSHMSDFSFCLYLSRENLAPTHVCERWYEFLQRPSHVTGKRWHNAVHSPKLGVAIREILEGRSNVIDW